MPQTLESPRSDTPPPAFVSNAEKARALIGMLEQGGTASASVPPERLRDWAADLIRTVEGARAAAPATSAPAIGPARPGQPAPGPARRSLFTNAPPRLAPATPVPAAPPPRPAQTGRLTLTAPMPHRAVVDTVPAVETGVLTPAQVRRIVFETIEAGTLGREHPAIVALTLMGKPTLEQAAALRRLPGGQVRAVHRMLRQLEPEPARTGAVAVSG